MHVCVSRLVLLLSVLLSTFFVTAPARGDDSVTKTLIGNARSDAITVYWTALGCAGSVDGRVGVCHSVRLEPGQSASYTWLWGQTVKQVSASCMAWGLANEAKSARWFDSSCKVSDARPTTAASRYLILNKVNGQCLDPHGYDAASGTNVGLYRCDGGIDQVFLLVPNEYGTFKNGKSGVCLDVAGYDGASNADVGLYTCESQDDQQWTITSNFNGESVWTTIRNKKKDLCLEAEGDAKSGARVRITACDNSDRQKWILTPHP